MDASLHVHLPKHNVLYASIDSYVITRAAAWHQKMCCHTLSALRACWVPDASEHAECPTSLLSAHIHLLSITHLLSPRRPLSRLFPFFLLSFILLFSLSYLYHFFTQLFLVMSLCAARVHLRLTRDSITSPEPTQPITCGCPAHSTNRVTDTWPPSITCLVLHSPHPPPPEHLTRGRLSHLNPSSPLHVHVSGGH